ncbi:hypothetical protein AX16_010140 [Volvariella volvacea WC 439]|nr:hypothetical protein AX16_010140 [Volvariella volvacea WC 439]
MKVAITGSSGLVGKYVVRNALNRGCTVIALDIRPHSPPSQEGSLSQAADNVVGEHADNPNYTYFQVDLEDFKATKEVLQKHAPGGLIHLAVYAPSDRFGVTMHNVNVAMAYNVLTACAELGIARIAQASSVNVINLSFAKKHHFNRLPLDENHPLNPDEPYGLAKAACELQADSIVRRYPTLRIASLRPSYCVPSRSIALARTVQHASSDLWGYTHLESVAEAFILAITVPNANGSGWQGHESFFIVAPTVATEEKTSQELKEEYWKDVPWRDGRALEGYEAFFDSSKATRLLGWVHKDRSYAQVRLTLTIFE